MFDSCARGSTVRKRNEQITATSHWTHQWLHEAEILMKQAPKKSRRPVILMDMYYVYCSFKLAVLKSRDLKWLRCSRRLTDTNRVLEAYIVDTSFAVHWGVCHKQQRLTFAKSWKARGWLKVHREHFSKVWEKIRHYTDSFFAKQMSKGMGD